MAFNPPSAEQVETIMMLTGLDRAVVITALNSKNNDVEAVTNEYFDSPDKFTQKYAWDESVFSSNREGDTNSAPNNTAPPSFVIHPADDNQILYGSEPNSFYAAGAPSRPPSRATTRSPLSRVIDLTAAEYTTNAPSNRQEEEAQLQRAINESLSASGVQSPQGLPAPPPLPQQSGITGGDAVLFGPANRPDYDPNEWAMVRLQNRDPDPEAALRARAPTAPVFLRCRITDWGFHRLGAVLVILHAIPAARNALLQVGSTPEYGYGSNQEWWKGEPILPPAQQAAKEAAQGNYYAVNSYPPWTDELHRLIAFLDSTDRTYGTADILADAKYTEKSLPGDSEQDFFRSYQDAYDAVQEPGSTSSALIMTAEVMPILDNAPVSTSRFVLLDADCPKETLTKTSNLYSIWDLLFYMQIGTPNEDLEAARMALITEASDVITFRFGGSGSVREPFLPKPIEVPETFYIDRYMAVHKQQVLEIQMKMSEVSAALQQNAEKEAALTRHVQSNNKIWDRRVMIKAAIRRCQARITQVKNAAFWRDHTEAHDNGGEDYYLPEHSGEPKLWPQEAKVVAHYETKIQQLEESLAYIDRVMNVVILPERQALQEAYANLCSLLTGPSDDPKWNATHKYTLRGVVSDQNTVFVRRREPVLMEMDETSSPTDQWWKISCLPDENNVVLSGITTYDVVMREACGTGCKPILIFATDKALDEDPVPLSDALKTFVKFDNRHFKQELSQAEQQQSSPKRLKTSVSLDSLATNHMENGVPRVGVETTERLARVSLDSSSPKSPEMQERPRAPLIARPGAAHPISLVHDEGNGAEYGPMDSTRNESGMI
ncbi:hypothetical protein B0H63DRAFT_512593 [Podospora didyma]|uniref:UBA domain-containing protein n=1 Tax=Podospora didyma TaxID=330526 RepID=A0AAE0KL92_9PEZI|nr:hypothetical protein B0H63DRAFT_512593 [Podospora didyma]